MNRLYLNSIQVDTPPAHTQVPIKCDLCSKREVCSYQSDYRKVATLIQNVLGDPQLDREVITCDCGFTGFEFEDMSIFPKTYELVPKEEESITANFLNARYSSKDTVKLLVEVNKYFVLFIFKYDESFDKYTTETGRELIYSIPYELTDTAIESLQEPLKTWRAEMIEREEASKDQDIINTTPFSAILNCKYFAKYHELGVRNSNQFTNYNVCEDDDRYRHIATYHKEDAPVKEAHNCPPQAIGYYPWFIPAPAPCPPPKPPKRRDDQ